MSLRRDLRIRRCLKRHGIVRPITVLRIARRVNRERGNMPLSRACALLDQESGGGHNVFGHDPTIFAGAGRVTRRKYLAYKRQRGHTRMQGVGPLQLTWWEFQDQADRRGGCWKPSINIYVGLTHLSAQIREHGYQKGLARYNGSGPAAQRYAAEVTRRKRRWKRTLDLEVGT